MGNTHNKSGNGLISFLVCNMHMLLHWLGCTQEELTMIAKVPPGRSILKASWAMARDACCGSSCITKHIDTRSAELSASPVLSAAACWNLQQP